MSPSPWCLARAQLISNSIVTKFFFKIWRLSMKTQAACLRLPYDSSTEIPLGMRKHYFEEWCLQHHILEWVYQDGILRLNLWTLWSQSKRENTWILFFNMLHWVTCLGIICKSFDMKGVWIESKKKVCFPNLAHQYKH